MFEFTNKNDIEFAFTAIKNSDFDVLKKYMEINEIDVGSTEIPIFIINAIENHSSDEIVKYLMSKSDSKSHTTYLFFAAQNDNVEVFRNIDHTKILKYVWYNALINARERQSHNVVKYLTENIHPTLLNARYELPASNV